MELVPEAGGTSLSVHMDKPRVSVHTLRTQLVTPRANPNNYVIIDLFNHLTHFIFPNYLQKYVKTNN